MFYFFERVLKAVLIVTLCYAVVLACFNQELFTEPTIVSLVLLVSAIALVLIGLIGKRLPFLRKLVLLAAAVFGTSVYYQMVTDDTGRLGVIMLIGIPAGLALIFFDEIVLYLPRAAYKVMLYISVASHEVIDEIRYQIARPFRSQHNTTDGQMVNIAVGEPTPEWEHMSDLFGRDLVRDLEVPVSS